MTNSEAPVGQPPAAWVWSQYRGVIADGPASAQATPVPAEPQAAPAPVAAAAGAEEKNSTLIGAGIAAAVLVIAGLTWLFTTQPASNPAPAEQAPAATDSAPVKSEAAPAAATPGASAPAATSTPDAPKADAPAAHDPAKKKKKH